jgi:dCMP deaminase
MEACEQHAQIFSTCGKQKYAALLVDSRNRIVSTGYNGGPSSLQHCSEGGCPRLTQQSLAGSNYDNCIAIHAEQNAFLHCNYNSDPIKLYVNGPPCFTCAKLIANSTVKTVYCKSNTDYKDWSFVKSFLNKCSILVVEM